MRYEYIRKCLIILKNAGNNNFFSFYSLLLLTIKYTYIISFYKKTRFISVNSKYWGKVWIRTHTSDLDVFIQHFIYQELNSPYIQTMQNVDVILDAGANIGFTSLFLHKIFPNAKIIAIELDAENFDMLQKKCQEIIKSGKMKLFFGAFYPKRVRLSISGNEKWAYYVKEDGDYSQVNEAEKVKIFTAKDVEDIFKVKPSFIKMDIEGSEVAFLKDDNWCEEYFSSTKLAIELHGFEAYRLYFHQITKNKIDNAFQIGEYWFTNPKHNS